MSEVDLTTPPPVYTAPNTLTAGPDAALQSLPHPEKTRIRQAAYRARQLYPGVVGEVLSAELLTWEEFGYRLDSGGRIVRLVEHMLTAALPASPKACIPTIARPPYLTGDAHLR